MKDVQILRSFGVLNRTFLTYFSQSLAGEGLSYSEGVILANVGDTPGVTQQALAVDLVIDRAAVARAVKGLREKGLVREKQADADRRVKQLRLTRTGERVVAKIAQWNDAWIGFVTADLGARERDTFMAALGKLVAQAKLAPPVALLD
ncbi:MAG: winged helix-turn-helix transcriptional regulator [Sandaracinaceae bacterium]|jgi:DNA-binding MarR family transcriptional regulator|nr:winged helix-turn-helix transcriptional regulator [Sandaracinaceae bacterium]MBK6810401.1 winged helix-turn-helix transcriptional regulator [Sandaracinaceae bacterium]MBK7775269.1 winged helix-turn-helix transcriptional regulator [Sandaracinaceae bacterium]MBK8408265.1 winged helix-turn-helix transcriptional regulator [Sandaracinaceae bacterium]MBP7682455.1 winged helix-turn-helix transcriptional regulator [Deltaproteobacteria bacterium]